MEYANHPDYIQLSKFADDLDGLPKVWSTHAGGVIIGKRPLHEIVPLRRDKDGNIVIEYEKERTEENGLVKIDLLCISTLDIIVKTLLLIDKSGKISPKDDIIDYDRNDDKTYALISIGDTLGVFQLGGSAGTMDICKKIKPKNIEDLAIINALARPNAAKIRQPFVETRDSGKIAKPIHESLHNAFAPTLGYAVFEEVLMNVAKDSAGWDLHDADKLRKLTKLKGKYPEKVAKWREEFIEGAVNNKNISKNMAARIWDEVISSFGGYAFNKSLYFLQEVDIYTKEGKFSKTTSIKNVNVGDWVLSRDEDLKKDILVQVTGKHDHGNLPLVEIELTTGEKVKCTINHKFRVEETGTMLPLWIILEKNLTIVVKGVTNGIKLS